MTKTIIIDVDGVLTDGKVYYSESGERQKTFHSRDIPAIKRLKEKYRVVLLSASTWQGVKFFADRCGVEWYSGVKNKAEWASKNVTGHIICVVDSYDDRELCENSLHVFVPDDCSSRLYDYLFKIKNLSNVFYSDKSGGSGIIDDVEQYLRNIQIQERVKF